MWKSEQEFPDDNLSQSEPVARDTSKSENFEVKVAEKNWKSWLKFSKTFQKPEKNWKKADELRIEIEKLGYKVNDTEVGTSIAKK